MVTDLEMHFLTYTEAKVTIARPIHEVFDFLADGGNNPRWMPWVQTSTLVGYGGSVGATYSQRMKSSPLRRKWVVYRIVHFHSPVTLGVEANSLPGQPTAMFRLTPTDPRTTTVFVRADFSDSGASAPAGSVGKRWASQLVDSLPRTKSALESKSASGGPAWWLQSLHPSPPAA
jgi:uncharacterized membrane protein